MPYVSLAQEGWAHTPAGKKALGGAARVAEWDAATKGRKLPARKSSGGAKGQKPQHHDKPFGSFAP